MLKNILLDIGNVLLMIDRESTVREFSAFRENNGDGLLEPERVFLDRERRLMERGALDPRGFYEAFLAATGCRLSYRHFVLIWTRHFSANLPMIRLGQMLAGRLNVYLLSNTDPLHIPPLFDRFPQTLFFHDMALSYELGALKPEREFYCRALEKLGLNPGECLFVDDLEENVAGAEECGIRSVQYRNFAETRALIDSALAASGIFMEEMS